MAPKKRQSARSTPTRKTVSLSTQTQTISDAEQDRIITIWAKVVDTQMHFNEMSVKSRQLGLTFVAAALGVGLVLLSRGDDYSIPIQFWTVNFKVHITVILMLGALLALSAVRLLDLNVYHRMLRGAVTFGEDFEEHFMKKLFSLEKGMTQAISHYSRNQDANRQIGKDGKYKYTGSDEVTAEDKIRKFYTNTMNFLWVSALILFLMTNLSVWLPTIDENTHEVFSKNPPLVSSDTHTDTSKK